LARGDPVIAVAVRPAAAGWLDLFPLDFLDDFLLVARPAAGLAGRARLDALRPGGRNLGKVVEVVGLDRVERRDANAALAVRANTRLAGERLGDAECPGAAGAAQAKHDRSSARCESDRSTGR
jgi:hypothetical protein